MTVYWAVKLPSFGPESHTLILFSSHSFFFKQLPLLNHRNAQIKKVNITFLYCWCKKQVLYAQFEDASAIPRRFMHTVNNNCVIWDYW